VLDTHLGHRKFVELTAERDELTVSIRGLEVRDTELEMQLPQKRKPWPTARAAARTFEGELAELAAHLNEHRNALNSAEGRMAFNEERKAELEAASARTTRTFSSTREKLAQQEFDFIAANESLDQLNRLIAEKELQLAEQETRTRAPARNANASSPPSAKPAARRTAARPSSPPPGENRERPRPARRHPRTRPPARR
jgi:chromosome segregation protein